VSAPPDSTELRIGIVGFGRLAREFYLPALRMLRGVRVVAVADPLPASRDAAAARVQGAVIHADPHAMVASTALDGVLVASPPSTHLDLWRAATARGIAAFVEKPLILASEIDALDGRESDRRVMVDFNRRFWPPYLRLGALVRDGSLGRPVEIEFSLVLDVMGWSQVTRHRLDDREGGLLHDLGCHAIDLATELVGEAPAAIAADVSSRRSPGDHVRLRLQFAGGGSAVCELGYDVRTRERLLVRGPLATAWFVEPNAALHVEPAGTRSSRVAGLLRDAAHLGYRGLRRSQSIGRASVRGALAAFTAALRDGRPFSPGLDDGVRNARVVGAALRSAAHGGAQTTLCLRRGSGASA
jgi:predicted dehydrogenase